MEATTGLEMQATTRLQALADKLDCLTEADFTLLANASPSTVEAWRKRGTGPSYILIGNRYLYPRQAVSEYLHGLTRERARSMKGVLL
jgi:hypothetical protein